MRNVVLFTVAISLFPLSSQAASSKRCKDLVSQALKENGLGEYAKPSKGVRPQALSSEELDKVSKYYDIHREFLKRHNASSNHDLFVQKGPDYEKSSEWIDHQAIMFRWLNGYFPLAQGNENVFGNFTSVNHFGPLPTKKRDQSESAFVVDQDNFLQVYMNKDNVLGYTRRKLSSPSGPILFVKVDPWTCTIENVGAKSNSAQISLPVRYCIDMMKPLPNSDPPPYQGKTGLLDKDLAAQLRKYKNSFLTEAPTFELLAAVARECEIHRQFIMGPPLSPRSGGQPGAQE
jgi:hypothetical protein